MKSHASQAIGLVLLVFCAALDGQSQIKPVKKALGGTVTGKVTIKGKAAAGVVVTMRGNDFTPTQVTPGYRGTTDLEGVYRITDVPPGTYLIMPAAPAFVVSGVTDSRGKTLVITEGEAIEGINFSLTRGGVITGRVSDGENSPLVEERISLYAADTNNQRGPIMPLSQFTAQTDDRGIYRVFGIAAGRYKVAVGQSQEGLFNSFNRRAQYRQTYYPDVTDNAKASIIEVTEGSETSNVDITLGRALETFAATGQVVDGETGKPIENVRLGLQKIVTERNAFVGGLVSSNSRGEFRLENLAPGKYAVLTLPQPDSDVRSEPMPFDIIDQDVTGLLVRTSKGASINGIVVLEGTEDKTTFAKLGQLRLQTFVRNEGLVGANLVSPATINPDGSFRVGGLGAGKANFSLASQVFRQVTGFTIVRVERDGMLQPPVGMEVKSGEQIFGVRIVVNYGSGTIRGAVKFENGELPVTGRLLVTLVRVGEDYRMPGSFIPPPQVDARGHFVVEGLAGGNYDLIVRAAIPGVKGKPPEAKQQVSVADGAVTEVTMRLDLNPNPTPGNP